MDGANPPTVADAWSAVADAWDDRRNDLDDTVLAAAVASFVAAARVRPGDAVLELAAGPGSLASTWAQLVGAAGSVVVSDVAPGMVEVARRRTAGLANVDVALIDMVAIDRPDSSFDVVASRMGLMFVPEPARALAEMHRVLRAGGRVVAMTWGALEHNPWMTCVGMAAMLNGVVAGGPPVGPGSIFSLGDPARFAALLTEAGFGEVKVEELDVTFAAPTVDAHVARVGALAGPLAGAFASATDEQLAAVRATAAGLAAPYTSAEGLRLPGRAVLVSGTKQS